MKTALVTKYSSFKLFADLLDPRNRMKQVFEFNLKDIGPVARQMFFNMPTLLADRKWCEFDNDFMEKYVNDFESKMVKARGRVKKRGLELLEEDTNELVDEVPLPDEENE